MSEFDRFRLEIDKARNQGDVQRLEGIINELDEICDSCDCTGESIRLLKRAKELLARLEREEKEQSNEDLSEDLAWDDDNPLEGRGHWI